MKGVIGKPYFIFVYFFKYGYLALASICILLHHPVEKLANSVRHFLIHIQRCLEPNEKVSLLQPCKHGDMSSQKRQNETCGLEGFPATLDVSEMLNIIDFHTKSHYRLAT